MHNVVKDLLKFITLFSLVPLLLQRINWQVSLLILPTHGPSRAARSRRRGRVAQRVVARCVCRLPFLPTSAIYAQCPLTSASAPYRVLRSYRNQARSDTSQLSSGVVLDSCNRSRSGSRTHSTSIRLRGTTASATPRIHGMKIQLSGAWTAPLEPVSAFVDLNGDASELSHSLRSSLDFLRLDIAPSMAVAHSVRLSPLVHCVPCIYSATGRDRLESAYCLHDPMHSRRLHPNARPLETVPYLPEWPANRFDTLHQ